MSSSTWDEFWWVSFVVLGVWIVNGILIFYLLNQIDTIVNVQLYNYGLQFSYDWAGPYWTITRLMMLFLGLPMMLSTVVFALSLRRFKRKAPIFKREAEATQVAPEENAEVQMKEEQASQEVMSEPEPEREQEQASEPTTELTSEPIQEVKSEPVSETQLEVIQPEIVKVEEDVKNETATLAVSEEPVTVNEEPIAVSEEPKVKEETGPSQSCPYCGKAFNRPLVMLDFSSGMTRLVNTCPYCMHVLDYELNSTKSGESSEA